MRGMTQHYWRDSAVPFVELRSTYRSLQSYKPHFHPQLSLGAIIEGETRANFNEGQHLLREGDLVLISPYVVHSCNPLGDNRAAITCFFSMRRGVWRMCRH